MPSGQFRVDIPGFEYDRGAEISLADSWLHAQEHLRCQGMDKSYRIQTRRGSLNCRRVPQCWMLSGVQGTLKFRGAGGTDGSVAHGFHCTNCPSTAADFPSLTCLFVKRSSLSLSHTRSFCAQCRINQYKSAWHVLNGACLRSIQLRKPALVAEGTKQELSHELEVVLVHREARKEQLAANSNWICAM